MEGLDLRYIGFDCGLAKRERKRGMGWHGGGVLVGGGAESCSMCGTLSLFDGQGIYEVNFTKAKA